MTQGKGRRCTYPGCPWDVWARDLCRGHLGHLERGKGLRPLKAKRPKSVDPLVWAGRLFIVTEEHPTCWTWHRASGSGRGYIRADGREQGITRFMWSRLVEPIPDDHDADHLCSNVLCANVAHLQAIPRPAHRDVTVSRSRELKRRQELEPDAELEWIAPDRPLPTSEALKFAMRYGLPFWMLGEWRNVGGVPSAYVAGREG